MRKMYSLKQLEKIIKKEVQKGNLLISGNVEFENDVKIGGDLDITGDAKLFENIVDKDGHSRFIEGDLVIEEIEGLNIVYAKWSLSGSHLLFVVAGSVDANTTLTGLALAKTNNLPQWIKDKIHPVTGASYGPIEYKNFSFYTSGYSGVSVNINFSKTSQEELSVTVAQNFAPTDERYFRIAFDLLIDNE